MARKGLFEKKGIDPLTGKRKSYYGKTQDEANRKAGASYGTLAVDTLYGYYVTAYLPTVQGRSANWKEQIIWAMDTHVLPIYGHRPLASIDRKELQRFFNALCGRMKVSSARKVKIVLGGVLNLAEDDEAVTKNPLRRVRLPSAIEPDKTALAPEHVWSLIHASHDRIRPFVVLASFGLPLGEALGVTRAAMKNGVVHVFQQVLQPKGGCIVSKSLKTPQRYRKVPLPADAADMALNANQKSGIWVCSDSEGGYMTPNNTARELEEAVALAGIPRVTAHELRHTFISILENELECPPAIVAALAGKKYAGPNKGYSHPTQAQLLKWTTRYWERLQESNVYTVTTSECRTEAGHGT